jgi:hypothetical protein
MLTHTIDAALNFFELVREPGPVLGQVTARSLLVL